MRTWPGLAAIGAGLVHLGIAAGLPPLLLAPLAVVGAAECAWGVGALARRTLPAPALALAAAAVLVGANIVLLLAPGGHHHGEAPTPAALPLGATTGASLLDLATAVLLALTVRRGRLARGDTGPLRFLVTTGVAAGAVGLITTSSLAMTAVGAHHGH